MITPSDNAGAEATGEQEYLISRGVRPLAIIGRCNSDRETMLRAVTRLESFKSGDAIPFVADCGNGRAEFGYATHAWVIDLYRFVVDENGPVPDEQRGRLLGLLLGYSPDAIARFDETTHNRLIASPPHCELAEPVSNGPP